MAEGELLTVEHVLADPLPDGVEPHCVTAIVIVVEYIDPETGAFFLGFQRNSDVGIWRHLGMIDSVRNDHLAALWPNSDDD